MQQGTGREGGAFQRQRAMGMQRFAVADPSTDRNSAGSKSGRTAGEAGTSAPGNSRWHGHGGKGRGSRRRGRSRMAEVASWMRERGGGGDGGLGVGQQRPRKGSAAGRLARQGREAAHVGGSASLRRKGGDARGRRRQLARSVLLRVEEGLGRYFF
ncbi:hypothetical protein BRADI_2g26216v3 [Brachypodium distachyon]|uniref:Uncharacterized protein n=1 Tax=Brachypodium distachyon TaxID=15368 RepID=A0A0Q3QZ22_BRADI|nr:hypothetical protein BRADI_2g26216v3 [Brachypodium distachyon]